MGPGEGATEDVYCCSRETAAPASRPRFKCHLKSSHAVPLAQICFRGPDFKVLRLHFCPVSSHTTPRGFLTGTTAECLEHVPPTLLYIQQAHTTPGYVVLGP